MMQFLLDIPLVMAFAKWIWGEDPNVTPEFCVGHLPLMNEPCWSRAVAKGLGIGIILGSCLNKAPVIFNILRAKSGAGLAREAVYGEILVYANGFFYGFLEGFPLTAYGENLALMLQSLAIMFLIWQYTENPPVGLQERGMVIAMAAIYVALVTSALSPAYHYILMASIWPVMLYARGSQIISTFRIKHTGAQSIVTTSLNLLGSAVRVLTTLKEVGFDVALLTGYALSILLNFTMFVQYWMYRSNTEKFLHDLRAKKES